MKTALITGAAGFLGSHLCDKLLANNMAVIGMDNLITGSMSNIAHLQDNPNFRFVNHDVCEHIVIEGDLDYILHFLKLLAHKLFCNPLKFYTHI